MKNWLIFLPAIIVGVIAASVAATLMTGLNYKSQIRQLDKSISEKQERIKDSEVVIGKLREGISERDESIAKRDGLIREKDGEIEVIRKERDSWKGKVEEMTPSEVVIRTRGILNCENIFERPDGALFTFACAKVNLRALRSGEFSFANEEVKKLNEKITDMVAKDLEKDAKIVDLEDIILEKDSQLADERGTSADWKDKFNLCEGEKKKARKKGRKEGSIIGGIIGGLIGFFLGK